MRTYLIWLLIGIWATVNTSAQYIPIGGNGILDWVVSNPISVSIIIQTTNSTGGLRSCGMSGKDLAFSSYGSYHKYVVSNSSRLFSYTESGSENIRYKVITRNKDHNLFVVDTNLFIESNLFKSFETIPEIGTIVLPIGKNISSAVFQSGYESSHPVRIAENGILIDQTMLGNGRKRLTIKFKNGETKTYTQNGNELSQPNTTFYWIQPPPAIDSNDLENYLRWSDRYGWYAGPNSHNTYVLIVHFSPGSDTVVERSDDLATWTEVNRANWDSWMTEIVIPIRSEMKTSGFYRARSY